MDAEQIKAERESVVGSAKAWLGTPYHHMAEVRGSGADCITFLRGAFKDARLGLEIEPIEYYPQDWAKHRNSERYMEGMLRYCVEMPPVSERTPEPGDILLFKFARAYSHGALVVDFPNLIHSYVMQGVVRVNLYGDARLTVIGHEGGEQGQPRPIKVFTLKRWVS